MATDIGTGATIVFATTGAESDWAAEVMNISFDGMSREFVESSHMGTTGAKTFVVGDLYDPGEVSLDLNFDQDALPDITAAAEIITITMFDGPGVTTTTSWAFSGALSGYSWTAPLEDKMTAQATIKVLGGITVT